MPKSSIFVVNFFLSSLKGTAPSKTCWAQETGRTREAGCPLKLHFEELYQNARGILLHAFPRRWIRWHSLIFRGYNMGPKSIDGRSPHGPPPVRRFAYLHRSSTRFGSAPAHDQVGHRHLSLSLEPVELVQHPEAHAYEGQRRQFNVFRCFTCAITDQKRTGFGRGRVKAAYYRGKGGIANSIKGRGRRTGQKTGPRQNEAPSLLASIALALTREPCPFPPSLFSLQSTFQSAARTRDTRDAYPHPRVARH